MNEMIIIAIEFVQQVIQAQAIQLNILVRSYPYFSNLVRNITLKNLQ